MIALKRRRIIWIGRTSPFASGEPHATRRVVCRWEAFIPVDRATHSFPAAAVDQSSDRGIVGSQWPSLNGTTRYVELQSRRWEITYRPCTRREQTVLSDLPLLLGKHLLRPDAVTGGPFLPVEYRVVSVWRSKEPYQCVSIPGRLLRVTDQSGRLL